MLVRHYTIKKRTAIVKTIKVLGRRVVERIEENIYELEVPKHLSEEEVELFILKNRDELRYIKNQNVKTVTEGEVHVKKILGGAPNPESLIPDAEVKKANTEYEYVDSSLIKEALNQSIIKGDFESFRHYFLKNKDNLRKSDVYLLLHNSLNNNLPAFATFIFGMGEDIIEREHLFKILEGVGVVDSLPVVLKYIELGYDKLDINGRTIKEIYESRGVEWRTTS